MGCVASKLGAEVVLPEFIEVRVIGDPGSGKSTFLKQMRLSNYEYTEDERYVYRKAMREGSLRRLRRIESESPRYKTTDNGALPIHIGGGSLDVEQIWTEDYLPTDDDIVRFCEPKAMEVRFNAGCWSFHAVEGEIALDVAKITVDPDLLLVFFDISSYDKVSDDGMDWFEKVTAQLDFIFDSHCYDGVPRAVVLNKADMLTSKLIHTPMSTVFPDYDAEEFSESQPSFLNDTASEAAWSYVQQKLLKRYPNEFVHVISTINASECCRLMSAIGDTFMQSPLHGPLWAGKKFKTVGEYH